MRNFSLQFGVGLDVKDVQVGNERDFGGNFTAQSIVAQFNARDETIIVASDSVPRAFGHALALPARRVHPGPIHIGGMVQDVHGITLLKLIVSVILNDFIFHQPTLGDGLKGRIVLEILLAVHGNAMNSLLHVLSNLLVPARRFVGGRHGNGHQQDRQDNHAQGNVPRFAMFFRRALNRHMGLRSNFFDRRQLIVRDVRRIIFNVVKIHVIVTSFHGHCFGLLCI
mmetsp:Transcript_106101/g.306948  ORF Transcript_106101/g.306948 Transcript_106101/m.306948 type:complete len:225 (+) Transcript_106101:212-886(+)